MTKSQLNRLMSNVHRNLDGYCERINAVKLGTERHGRTVVGRVLVGGQVWRIKFDSNGDIK